MGGEAGRRGDSTGCGQGSQICSVGIGVRSRRAAVSSLCGVRAMLDVCPGRRSAYGS